MNYRKISLENRTLMLLLGSLYLALILMILISLSIYQSNLLKQYEENINFLAMSFQEMNLEQQYQQKFSKCKMDDDKICSLCKINKQFAAININFYTKQEHIPPELQENVITLKDNSFLTLSIDATYFSQQLEKIRSILLYVFLFLSVIFTFIILYLNKKLFYPLKCLVSFCHAIREGEKTIICPANSYEIQELQDAIVSLLEKNKQLYNKKAHMFKEIAHELKSPIAIMQARLSLLMGEEISNKKFQKYIDETTHDIEDIKKLIYEILFIEEIEINMHNTHKKEISMKQICQSMQQKFEPLLELNDIKINVDWSQDFTIYSYEDSILKVMQAIYENISMHAQKHTTINIDIDTEKKQISIHNAYLKDQQTHFISTKIGTQIIQRLTSKLHFDIETEQTAQTYTTRITFHC